VRSSLTTGGKGEREKFVFVESGVTKRASRETYQEWKNGTFFNGVTKKVKG